MTQSDSKYNGGAHRSVGQTDPKSAPPRVTTSALMKGGRRLLIRHNDEDYMLQITRSGRLILTK